jgi:hypothetical protein
MSKDENSEKQAEILLDLVIRVTALERVFIESGTLDETRFKAELGAIRSEILSKISERQV